MCDNLRACQPLNRNRSHLDILPAEALSSERAPQGLPEAACLTLRLAHSGPSANACGVTVSR